MASASLADNIFSLRDRGLHEQAIEQLIAMIRRNNRDAEAFVQIAICFAEIEKLDESKAALEHAQRNGAAKADVSHVRAMIAHASQEHKSAARLAEKALDNNRTHSGALAILLKAQLEMDEAARAQKALKRFSNARSGPEALLSEAAVHLALNHADMALSVLNDVIAQAPDCLTAYISLATALSAREEWDEVDRLFEEALGRFPNNKKLLSKVGWSLGERKEYVKAAEYFERAAAAETQELTRAAEGFAKSAAGSASGATLLANAASAYFFAGDYIKAKRMAQQAVDKDPTIQDAHATLGRCAKHRSHDAVSLEHLKAAMELPDPGPACRFDYAVALANIGEIGAAVEAFDIYPEGALHTLSYATGRRFHASYHPGLSEEEVFERLKGYEEETKIERMEIDFAPYVSKSPRKIRVGYVSGDFKLHAAQRFTSHLFENHNHDLFDIVAYSKVEHADKLTAVYKEQMDEWRDITKLSNEKVARLIADDKIDILVDTSAHTQGHALPVFAAKPTPIALTWLADVSTTGLKAIDYFVTDPIMTPPGVDHLYTEEVMRIDGPSMVFRPLDEKEPTIEAPLKRNGHITFGSNSRAIRINDQVAGVWAKILNKMPNSRLVLVRKQYEDDKLRPIMRERFERAGVDSSRIDFEVDARPARALGYMDIMLDCFPHGAGTTLFESAYYGVPFITLEGRVSYGRVGTMIAANLGHDEWIAQTKEAYVEKAVALASDSDALLAQRDTLRGEMLQSPLMDHVRFARNMEDAFMRMWRNFAG